VLLICGVMIVGQAVAMENSKNGVVDCYAYTATFSRRDDDERGSTVVGGVEALENATRLVVTMQSDIPDEVVGYSRDGNISSLAKECVRRSLYLDGYQLLLSSAIEQYEQSEDNYFSITHRCAKLNSLSLSKEDGTFLAQQVFENIEMTKLQAKMDALLDKKRAKNPCMAVSLQPRSANFSQIIDSDCMWKATEYPNVVDVTAYFYDKSALLALLNTLNANSCGNNSE